MGMRTDEDGSGGFPAYGPIESTLGYAAFYVFVDRATPTIVAVFAAAIPGVDATLVATGTAALLWFVLGVTVLDQLRRQLAALGLGSVDEDPRLRLLPAGLGTAWHVAVAAIGGLVAAGTFEIAIRAGISLIRATGTLDLAPIVVVDVVVMVVFFAAYGAATRAMDRLVIGGIRAVGGP